MPKNWNWIAVPEEAVTLFSTENQRRVFSQLRQGKMFKEISKENGVSFNAIEHTVARMKATLGRHGCDPEHDYLITAGSPFVLNNKTVHRKVNPETGELEVHQIWDKPTISAEGMEEAFREFISGLCSDIKPVKAKAAPKTKTDSDLLSAIFIGDAHLGMYAYGKETKHSDFDTDIAVKGLRDAVDDLVERAPNAETCMIVDVGDFMHQNGTAAKTAKGTELDVDSRYPRVLRQSGKVMKYIISRALEKFKKVIVVISRGNHNQDPAIAVQEILSAYFHDEPRVQVLDTDGYFHYIEWGKWLFGVNHGDKIKPPKLVSVMARDMATAWGRTTHRMWALGHYHHEQVMEMEGCTVHRFGALPPPDAWHASSGYGGDGQMQMITFRKEGGKHSTLVYDVPRPIVEPDVVIA